MNLINLQGNFSGLILLYFGLYHYTLVLPLVLGFILGSIFGFSLIPYYILDKNVVVDLMVKFFAKHYSVKSVENDHNTQNNRTENPLQQPTQNSTQNPLQNIENG